MWKFFMELFIRKTKQTKNFICQTAENCRKRYLDVFTATWLYSRKRYLNAFHCYVTAQQKTLFGCLSLLRDCTAENLIMILFRNHPFSAYKFFFEKLTFLHLDWQTYVGVTGGKKCQLFWKVCVRTKWMIPYQFPNLLLEITRV